MEQNILYMSPQQAGRIKYLLLVLIPTLAYTEAVNVLCSAVPFLAPVRVWLGMIGMTAIAFSLGYFLIFKKNHHFEVSEKRIHVKEITGQAWDLPAHRICRYRRNLLGELVLFDEDGKRLLTVESNMTEFEKFQVWLERRGIQQM